MKRQTHTILLAEDDPNDQFLIERAFRSAGIKAPIQMVSDGAQAIAYLKGEGQYADRYRYEFPSFLITDLKMPLVDGFGVLEVLRSDPELFVVPVVILSASQDADDIKRAYQLGAKSYIVKPSDQTGLQAMVKQLHDYWCLCEVPQVDGSGRCLQTQSAGKLGERFI